MQQFLKYIFFITALVIGIVACNGNADQPGTGYHEPKNLNTIETVLPEGQGYETFKMNCLSCHSERYILMQPDLPGKTWAAIVTKMQKSFGAPVSDSSAKEIVAYLTEIKGKK